MNVFDLHCDTIGECCTQNQGLCRNHLDVSLCKGEYLDNWCEVFAVWMPDEYRGQAAIDYFDKVFEKFQCEMAENSLQIKHCLTVDDINKTLAEGKCAAILSAEGGSAVAGSLDRLHDLYTIGVRLITLTWNGSNEIGNGSGSCQNDGLTAFGKQAVREMERLKMVIDVSHLNESGFYDVASETDGPFIASHSNASAVFYHARNLDDRQIKILIEKQGLMGINFCEYFLGTKCDDGFEAVYRHISHVLDLGGEDILSIGSDYDGCPMNPELKGIEKLPDLREYLLKKGLADETIENIFFKNAYKVFERILKI